MLLIQVSESDTVDAHIVSASRHGLNGETRVDPEKSKTLRVEKETLRKARSRLQSIGTELRRMWVDIVQEPIPDEMQELLRKLDEVERKRSGIH